MIQEFGLKARKESMRTVWFGCLILFSFLKPAAAAEWSEVLLRFQTASKGLNSCPFVAETNDEICMNPVKEICENRVPPADPVFSDEDRKLMGEYRFYAAAPEGYEPKKFRALQLKILEGIVAREQQILQKGQSSPAALDEFFADLEKGFQARLDKTQMKAQSKSNSFSATRLRDYIKTNARKKPDEVSALLQKFISECGVTGMIDNASYDYNTHSLNVCPGMLEKNFAQEKPQLSTMACVLGHELGHSVDRNQVTAETLQKYEPFLACVKKEIDADASFNTVSTAKKYISSVYRSYESKRPPGYLEVSRQASQALQNLNAVEQAFGADDKMNSYGNELIADLYCESAMVNELKKIKSVSAADKKRFAVQSLSSYCEDMTPINKIVWGGLQDGMHPPVRYRLENLMRNPEMRGALGCSPLAATDRKSCSP